MTIKTFNRYDIKYIITNDQFVKLLPLIQPYLEIDEHCQGGKFYPIYNIYFDNDTDEVIRSSLAKPYYKEKLRIRSYKIPTSMKDLVFIELKKKIGKLNNKRRAIMPLQSAYDFIFKGIEPTSNQALDQQIIDELAYYLKTNPVHPKVYLSYDRLAFVGKEDKSLRITFDRNIISRRDDVLLENGDFGTPILDSDELILEIKHTSALPFWLSRVLSTLSLYNKSFSKYGTEYQLYHFNNKAKKANSAA